MSGYIYLVKKGDLYAIGQTNDLAKKMRKIRPDEIIETIQLNNPDALEARLLRRYKTTRLPETNYFYLNINQVEDCKKQFGKEGKLPKSFEAEFSIALTGSLLVFIVTIVASISFGLNFIYSLSVSTLISSFPMWSLFLFGNFGGYDCNDLSLFSSWGNRSNAFFSALFLSLAAYIIFKFGFFIHGKISFL